MATPATFFNPRLSSPNHKNTIHPRPLITTTTSSSFHCHLQMHAIAPNFHPLRRPRPSLFHPTSHARLSTTTPIVTALSTKPSSQDPTLRSTWSHRSWVAAGFTTVLLPLANSISAAAQSGALLEPLAASLLGYVLADLSSGVYHWAVDNYGDRNTPIFGSQIEAFQGHHKYPWTITKRQFSNNLHSLARAVTFVVLPIDLLVGAAGDNAAVHAFVGACSGCIMLSQQFHAWAHGTKSRLPEAVVALQECGVLVSRGMHSAHHRPPYDNNYCIVSGVWNEWLDAYKVFEAMEMVIFFKFGVRPRSWSETQLDWLEEKD